MSFEESLDVINNEIAKRKSRWNLTGLNWMDFDDVAQIIRAHIYKKWNKYDVNQPLLPWVNKVISSQIKNLVRNNYTNYARPCLKCPASQGENLCSIYGEQCSKCPLFDKWVKKKKVAYDIKLPVSIEYHTQELKQYEDNYFDLDKSINNLNEQMQKTLKANEWIVYEHLYILHLPAADLPSKLGFKTTENNKSPGYKQIRNIQKNILIKAKKLINNTEIDIL